MPDTIKIKAATPIIREPSTNNIPAGFIYHLSLVAEAACKLVRMLLIALGLQVGPLLTPVLPKPIVSVKVVGLHLHRQRAGFAYGRANICQYAWSWLRASASFMDQIQVSTETF